MKSLFYTIYEDRFKFFLYFYFFVMPWNFFKAQMGVLTLILLLLWIEKFRKNIFINLKKIVEFKPLIILFAFILYTYVASLWSDSIKEALEHLNQFHKYYFLLIPILFTSLSETEAKNSIKVLIVSFASYSFFSLLIYLNVFSVEGSNYTNPKGILAYAIATQYMAIGALSAFFFGIFSQSKQSKIFFLTLSLICFLALVVNNSRTSQLAFLLSSITLLLFFYKASLFRVKALLFSISSLLIVFAFSFYLIKDMTLKRYTQAYDQFQIALENDVYEGAFGARLFFNKAAIEIFSDNFVFGTGPVDNYHLLRNMQTNHPHFNHHITSSFHSQHFEILTGYGLVGYSLFAASILSLLYYLRHERLYFFVGLSIFTTFFFISFANYTILKKPVTYIFISFFILLAVVAYRQYTQKGHNDLT
ncbi:MAG: O-antigen ligase family protein [Arcobacteraceae bacterium]